MTFYYEGQIAREIIGRKAVNKGEKFKIDYCTTMYSHELSNMPYLFSYPVKIDNDKIYPDRERHYTPEELTALIRLYKAYRDVAEREILVEYVDRALDLFDEESNSISCLSLLSEVAELGRRKIIRIPQWINSKLEYTVKLALALNTGNDAELALPLLTLQIITKDQALERKAQRIINRCYRSAFDGGIYLGKRIEYLHTAVTCCDYVSRFSVRKVASTWNELCSLALSSEKALTPKQTFQLLEIAKECEDYASICAESKYRLRRFLEKMSQPECLEAMALNEMAKMRF